jgi:hypothetical protein
MPKKTPEMGVLGLVSGVSFSGSGIKFFASDGLLAGRCNAKGASALGRGRMLMHPGNVFTSFSLF